MEWLSFAADVIGILGGFFAFFAWMQTRRLRKEQQKELARQNKRIKIILHLGGKSVELPTELRRAEFTRAEVLGRLGMLPTDDGKRFSLNYLNTAEFLKRLNEISMGDGNDVLIIPCDEKEFGQFNPIK